MNESVIEIGPAQIAQGLPPNFLGIMHDWGIEVIRIIQRIESPALAAAMQFISALGSEMLFVPFILFILWWIDEKRGLSFGVFLIISAWINAFMKDLFAQPRPFHIDPSLGIAAASGYGAPSGHAQLAVCFWIPAAAWLEAARPRRRQLIWAAAIFIILIIGFSRLYLGAHFPTDIFAGWILGAVFLFIFFALCPRIGKILASGGIRAQ
ncbi:MAG: phosphatase PAP2 family protein, partial [Treponema sp.]|nr:phosphatase PAP2 family protein [Treponema sp.]